MLVLSRKKHGELLIGETVVVRVLEIRGDQVRLGIIAPKDVKVLRRELEERDDRNDELC